jgi:exodeoxyribonuclease-3
VKIATFNINNVVKRLLDEGWSDALRQVHPTGPLWTFWAYLRNRWPNDKGLHLDHLLLTPDLAERLVEAGVDR